MGGNSCLAGDYVGDWSFDQELIPGDLIVFDDMIHYTMVKTTMFNGVPHPSIGIWNDRDGFRLLRKYSFEDYKNRMA
jgi:carboxynorspermidine decarboxylase